MAIEANKLPKLIPTTGGSAETTGVSALPVGTALNGTDIGGGNGAEGPERIMDD
jgi:hypothetical protein